MASGRVRSFSKGYPSQNGSQLSASRGRIGSLQSLSSLSGSTQNILDPMRLMSMQDDAQSRRISSEIMRRSLHGSVASPCKRRFSMHRTDYRKMSSSAYGDSDVNDGPYSRMFQSLPVTPAQSHATSPSPSPTRRKRFRVFLSRAGSPLGRMTSDIDQSSLEVEEDSWKGLPSLFKPKPKYLAACAGSRTTLCGEEFEEDVELDENGLIEKSMRNQSPPDTSP